MSEWRDAVRKEILKYCRNYGTAEFELQDLVEFSEQSIKNKFPENDTWEASIRRTLQELRDNSEVEFLGDGRYRRKALNISDDSVNLPTPASSINYKLQYSLTHYNEAKSESNWNHPVINIIDSEIPIDIEQEIQEKCGLDTAEIENLSIEGSCGKGRMANIPWIGIFDNRVANGPQDGLYVVYLFDTVEKRLFLTLNQGMTELKDDYGLSATKKVLSTRADILREKVDLEEFEMSGIELPVELLTGRNKHYGKSTICYNSYDADQFPGENEIISDLCDLVSEYQNIVSDGYYQRLVSAFDEEEKVQRHPEDTSTNTDPTVWIEKTQVEGREYKQEGKYELGNALMAPSRDEGGRKRYEAMREAEVGDIVLHLLQDQHQFAGVSVIDSELTEDFDGPPSDRWTNKQQEEGGYLRWLRDYEAIEPHIHVYNDLLENSEYEEELQDIRENSGKIFYDKRLSLNQGHYFTHCPDDLVNILINESDHLNKLIQQRGYENNEPWDSNESDETSSEDKEETKSEYWGLVSGKESAGERFIEDPNKRNLGSFLEEFWTLRAAPSIEHILSEESNWFNQQPDEIANILKKAINQNDISIATSINGFGVSSASEALRALEPTEFPILNDPACQGMSALGYDPKEPSNANPEDYPEFVDDVKDALERFDLVQIAEEADGVFVPEWATELQLADHLFYLHSDDDYEFTFNEWLPCASTVETAPYYWVNQSAPSDSQTHLKSVPDDSFDTDIGRLEVNDTVFHHDEGQVVGYSTVNQEPQTIKINNKLGCKVEVSFSAFEDPVPFSDVFEYLLHERDEGDEYFPVDESGLKSGYLFNLSEPAGNYILQQSKEDTPGDSQIHRLEERLSQPKFSMSLPTGLYFHEREESRLKQQINASLNSGKHIIFTGPPGTGKSKLAKEVAEQAAYRHDQIDGQIFTTATAEWTTFDTIGGYVPDDDGNGLKFDPRLFLRCFRNDDGDIQNKWLVVDELNRANIDKALGPLFSVLAKDSVQLPYEDENRVQIDWVDADLDDNEELSDIANDQDRYPVTPSWWLIGTMNTVDKTSLYDLSFAFMRRFSFIHVGVPKLTLEIEGEEIVSRTLLDPDVEGQNYATTWQQDLPKLRETIEEYHEELSVIWAIVNKYRPIGPAIVLDMLQHLHVHEGGDEDTPLTAAILSLVLPQMEGIREQDQLDLLNDLEKGLPIEASNNDSDRNKIELRIDFEHLRRKAYDMFGLDPDE